MSDNIISDNHLYARSLPSEDIDLRNLFSVIWEQKKILMSIILMGTIFTLAISSFIKTHYTATSSLLIDSNSSAYQDPDITSLAKSFSIDIGFILTEIEVIKSRNLAAQTVQKLKLINDPEFRGDNQNNDILDASLTTSNPKGAHDVDESDTITNFLDRLNVTSIPGSLAVKVSFTSKDAEKAALITNTLIDEYIRQRINIKYNEQQKLTKWLDKRIQSLRDQVLQAEMRAEQYRAENNLSLGKIDLLSAEQLSSLTNQRVMAQKEYSDIKAQLSQIQKSNGSAIAVDTVSNSINASLLKNLNLEKLTIETEISELSNRYGPKHPTMIKKKTELKEVQTRIDTQVSKAKNIVRNELNVAKERLDEIDNIISEATGQSNADGNAMIQLRELEREALTSRNILKTFLEKYKRVVDKDMIQDAGARVISYANIPVTPSSPDKRLILALGIFISSILALSFIFLHEKLYNKFRTGNALEDKFNLPCLGNIPFTRSGWNKNLVQQVLSNPTLPITESLHNIRIALKTQKSKSGQEPRVISFLSSVKNEGKTTTATLLASLAAKAGERVILIDANLRTPAVHEALLKNNDVNLVDYLTEQKDLKDIVEKDNETGLDVIFGQAVPNNAFNLLSLNKLDVLIEALKQNYDLVVIDTPPCLNASDARLVEQLSDFSLFSVKYNATKDKTVAEAVKSFQNHDNPALAFILTHSK